MLQIYFGIGMLIFSLSQGGNVFVSLSIADFQLTATQGLNIEHHNREKTKAASEKTIKLAYVIGDDSRQEGANYPVSSSYYNSLLQAQMAKKNLVHLQCKKGLGWDNNTTSGFFINVEAFAKDNNIEGNFSSCKNKVLLSVAHYINDRGGKYKAQCKIVKSFKTELGRSEHGIVRHIQLGDYNAHLKKLDFALLKIDELKFSQEPEFKTLKICTGFKAMRSVAGKSCTGNFEDEVIMPHLARSKKDKSALERGLNYTAKISSGKCCISGKDPKYKLLKHTCDMEARSSGSPLLRISGSGEPCVVGIQKGNSYEKVKGVKLKNNQTKKNYAVSVSDSSFKSHLQGYIKQHCLTGNQL